MGTYPATAQHTLALAKITLPSGIFQQTLSTLHHLLYLPSGACASAARSHDSSPVSCVLPHIPLSLSRPLFCCERVNVCRVSCRWSWCPMSCWHVVQGDPWQVPWVVHWRPWLDPRVQPALRRALGSTDHRMSMAPHSAEYLAVLTSTPHSHTRASPHPLATRHSNAHTSVPLAPP